MEREKRGDRIRTTCDYEKESCQKVVTKWLYKYHFSLKEFRVEVQKIEHMLVVFKLLYLILNAWQW